MPFQPGQSGNPGGRTKRLHELTELARSAMLDRGALSMIIDVALGNDPRGKDLTTWRWACDKLLSYGFGTAPQVIVGADEGEGYVPLYIQFAKRDVKEKGE